MIKTLLCFLTMLLSVHYCTYNKDTGVYEEYSSSELNAYNTGLPRLELTTPAPITSKEVWTEGASMKLYDKNGNLISEHTLSIRGRGNSTWEEQAKKPYALKLDKKASFWGLPKHKRWVLLANAYDRTMIRNDVAFYIAKQTELSWTPFGDYVELILNGRHQGTYYLCEQIKVDENRVNISKDGFLMEVDLYYDEVNKFKSARANLPYMFKEPDEDELTPEQFQWFNTNINAIEDLLWDDTRLLSQEYLEHLDINSFIDYWFVQELTMNLECNQPRSTYCYLEKGGKLTMGPVWDFDYKTWSNEWFATVFEGEDRNRHRADQFSIRNALYYKRLFQDPYFCKIVQERWELLKPGFYSVPIYIQNRANYLFKSDLVNYPMWPHEAWMKDEFLSFDESVNRIQDFYMRKLEFLNKRITNGDFSQP